MKRMLGAGVVAAALVIAGATASAQTEYASKELIDAANKEGKLVLYTANFTEPEQENIKEFNKKFPARRPAHHAREDRSGGRQAQR
jgi:iron(III) transport system substrate-binding protein